MGGAQLLHTRTPTQLPFTNAQKGHHMPEPDARTANTIIRQWEKLPKDKRQSMEGISEFARTAAQQNEKAFVRNRRDPYEKIMGWLLPRAHL